MMPEYIIFGILTVGLWNLHTRLRRLERWAEPLIRKLQDPTQRPPGSA